MRFGLEEPQKPGKVDFDYIFRLFGWLGWILARIFRGRVRELLVELDNTATFEKLWWKDEYGRLLEEARLRDWIWILESAAMARENLRFETLGEGRRILARANRAASQTRDNTVKQLCQLLLLGKIRLLEAQLKVAKDAGMEDQVVVLQDALRQANKEAIDQIGSIEKLVEALALFDVLMVQTAGSQKKKH